MKEAVLVCDARAMIGESPLFRDGRLYWTDPITMELRSLADDSFKRTQLDRPIWALAGLPDGRLVGNLDCRFCAVDPAGQIDVGPCAAIDDGCRLNVMTVDAFGGLQAGAMHRGLLATRGSIFHAPELGAVPVRVAGGLGVPNGRMRLSPTMIATGPGSGGVFKLDTGA